VGVLSDFSVVIMSGALIEPEMTMIEKNVAGTQHETGSLGKPVRNEG
jgi:hypothetical protein